MSKGIMDFYFLRVEDMDGEKYKVIGTFTANEDEINDTYDIYKRSLNGQFEHRYKSVSIEMVSLSLEEILEVLVLNSHDAKASILDMA
jgi:hypothetical protein